MLRFAVTVGIISVAVWPGENVDAFTVVQSRSGIVQLSSLDAKAGGSKKSKSAGGGFGASSTKKAFGKNKSNNKSTRKNKGNLIQTINEEQQSPARTNAKISNKKQGGMTYNKSEQEALLSSLASSSATNPIGKAVADYANASPKEGMDPFWELMPSLISSKFPSLRDNEMQRLAGFVTHQLNPCTANLEDDIIENEWRTHDNIHAYMPGLGPTQPFYDPASLELCRKMSENVDIVEQEYEALVQDHESKFQSVTSMNYDSGWKTLVLFYNGHRIQDFPYHLCPVTTSILESVPLAGRIAGFNRQQPQSGIPNHTDGNNMWLTCQMGIKVPDPPTSAQITVGPDTQHWERGQCLLYDTTYRHETFNSHKTQERVVMHVDFFNTIAMTTKEIEVLQYIYSIREQFMKAEGVSKVGAQIL